MAKSSVHAENNQWKIGYFWCDITWPYGKVIYSAMGESNGFY